MFITFILNSIREFLDFNFIVFRDSIMVASEGFINKWSKTVIDEKFSFTDPGCEINFALYGFFNCWRHLPP